MELLAGDANGAGSETLSTYTALGADVSTENPLPPSFRKLSFDNNLWLNIDGCGKKIYVKNIFLIEDLVYLST